MVLMLVIKIGRSRVWPATDNGFQFREAGAARLVDRVDQHDRVVDHDAG